MKRIEVQAMTKATFEGDQWEPVLNSTGEVIGLHARGTNCTVLVTPTDSFWDGEMFSVPENQAVLLNAGLAVLPNSAEPVQAVFGQTGWERQEGCE